MNNPFSNNRREGEKDDIFLFYQNMESWFDNSNFIFEGNRGSGKTSILSAFNYENVWLEQSKIVCDELITHNYRNTDRNPKFIGVIFKCESHDKGIWERWAEQYGIENAKIVYSTYLNFYFLEKLIGALDNISNSYDLSDKSMSDNAFVNKFISIAFTNREHQPNISDYSLYSLLLIFREYHNIVRQNIARFSSFEEMKDFLDFPENNCKLLIDECKLIQNNFKALKDTLFFILIDDINRVSEWQTMCINNMIVSYEYPVSFKLSSVFGLYKTKLTCDKDRPLGNSDATTIHLGYQDITKITQLADITRLLDMVFKSRIERKYPNAKIDRIESIFGKDMDIDNALISILRSSQKSKVRSLLDSFDNSQESCLSDYWLKKNKIKKTYPNNTNFDKIKANSEYFSKFKVSAVFSIIQEYDLGKGIEYSSMNVINHLICGSVRRFLKICEMLWPNMDEQLKQNNRIDSISAKEQSGAIKKCAKYVYNGIDSNVYIRTGIETTSRVLCDRIADIFLSYISKDSLRVTPECLSFRIDKSSLDTTLEEIINSIVLSEAFIKIDDNKSILIGLHPVLSPQYVLPYRSPFYYPQTISKEDLRSIIMSTDTEMLKVKERLIAKRLGKPVTEPDLFNQE